MKEIPARGAIWDERTQNVRFSLYLRAYSKLLEQDSIKPKGSPEYAGYSAPFTAPWLNRNEVMAEVK